MVQNKVPIASAGGTDEGELGTSFDKILSALQSLDSSDGILVLLDLGSAILSTEMAIEMLEEEQQQRVRLTYAPLVEGAVAAAMECSLGHSLAQVQQIAEEMADVSHLRQLKPVSSSETAAPEASQEQTAIPESASTSAANEAPWQTREIVLAIPTGLHARPASLFVKTAARFPAEVRVSKSKQALAANAKSILGVLSLSARQGERLRLEARGEQAEEALQELITLNEANFYEESAPSTGLDTSSGSTSVPGEVADKLPVKSGVGQALPLLPQEPWPGTPVSPGVALGEAFIYDADHLELSVIEKRSIKPDQIAYEQQRLGEALAAGRAELGKLQTQIQQRIGASEAAIFEAQAQMLSDPGFVEATLQAIANGPIDAASALAEVGERQAAILAGMDNPLFAARAIDLRDAVSRTIQQLGTRTQSRLDLGELSRPVILVAHDLTPSDTVGLNPQTVLGICTVQGGATSHAAILARSLGIPAIAGINEALLQQLHTGEALALDADNAQLYLAPSDELQREFQQRIQARQQQQQALQQAAQGTQAPLLIGGRRIQLLANVGSAAAAEAARNWGAEGIGLLRTEFLFAQSEHLPSEEEQQALYTRVFRTFLGETNAAGKPIVVRTLDAGADKPLPALKETLGELVEANPALGLRGIRIHLTYQDLLEQQLRAVLRAAGEVGNELHIMFPMITTVEEVRRCRVIFERMYADLSQRHLTIPEKVLLGIMVEVPSAVIMSADLAREVDFFSIGSNDLIQYTLACDRTNPAVSNLFPQMQPSILRSIRQVVEGASLAGKPVAVCGELAGDVHVAPILVGLGVQELSMTPTTLPEIRAKLKSYNAEELRSMAERACAASTAEEVNRLLV
jgi:phosphoenolpyruvate-protein phosphotransferase/dihydroxyacetone kinase phosphotransfer subunit